MKRPLAWVLAAVVSAAGAGVAVGGLWCRQAAAKSRDVELQATDRQLLDQYTTDYKLAGEQVVLLRAILQQLREDEAEIYRRNLPNLPAGVQNELVNARRKAQTRIEFMFDPAQRVRYEQDRVTTGKPK
jgi:hypothetical protein